MAARLYIQRVTHEFPTPGGGAATRVLDDVSFEVEPGEFLAIIGASGSGKTTLLRIMAGLQTPTAGVAGIDGETIAGPNRRVGVVFQRDSLFPWRDVMGNATYGLEARGMKPAEARTRASRYLDMVGLRGFEKYFPRQLSGGMRQRVNLARALAIEPDVLLMDEPFAALDAQTREIMQLELTRIREATGKTIVLVTHQIDEAVYLGDRVLTLSARPCAVRAITRIDLTRPRDLRIKRSDAFQAYVGQLWDMIEAEVMKSFGVAAT